MLSYSGWFTRFRQQWKGLRYLEAIRQVQYNLNISSLFVFIIIVCFSLFETSQSLFWASFGLVDLMTFELTGIKSFTRFWALLMFGSYSVINVIVLLNMLIAMMSNSYQIISVSCAIYLKTKYPHLWIKCIRF